MARFCLVMAIAMTGALLLVSGRSSSAAASGHIHVVLATKKCHTVVKKIHGKKKRVKVCTRVTVKAPTILPTDTSTPTNTPTVPPTGTPVPPTSSPTLTSNAASPGVAISQNTDGTIAMVLDKATGISAGYLGKKTGLVDCVGDVPVDGDMWLWVGIRERNSGSTTFYSSHQNFQLSDDAGNTYDAGLSCPEGTSDNYQEQWLDPGTETSGWIGFSIPAEPGNYTLSWSEFGAIPWTPFATITVSTIDVVTPPDDGSL